MIKKIDKAFVESIIFNLVETALIILSGLALNISLKYLLTVMLVFLISRGLFRETFHFKTWYRCLIWSSLTMVSLFVILKVDFILAVLFAIFGAFIMTGRANVNDMYMWKNKEEPSKYQDIMDYIKCNELNGRLIEFEQKLRDRNTVEYSVYKYRFRECKTFSEISELLNIDNPRIVEYLDKIAFAIRLYCGI